MSSRKIRKLEHYLNQGKVICGTTYSREDGERPTATMVCMQLTEEKSVKVDIEVYFSDIDISEFNLRDESRTFSTLKEAINYMEGETRLKFEQMHG